MNKQMANWIYKALIKNTLDTSEASALTKININ